VATFLGAIERRRGQATLKYAGLPGTGFDDICIGSARDALRELERGMSYARNRDPVERRRLLLLANELRRDVSRDPTLLSAPVCFAQTYWTMAHERMHAEISRVFPHQPRFTPAEAARHQAVNGVVVRFLLGLGSASQAFLAKYWPAKAGESAGEEFLTGIVGMAEIVRRKGPAEDRETATEYFSGYLELAKVPGPSRTLLVDLERAYAAAGVEFAERYGSNLTKAGLDFAKLAR